MVQETETKKSLLDQLQEVSVVIADSGDIDAIRQERLRGATTNPTLLLAAAQQSQYKPFLQKAIEQSKGESMNALLERLTVLFGVEILSYVSNRVSVEVDVRYSFDTERMVAAAQRLVSMFAEAGVDRTRILVKIAATWEGVEAVRILEKEGIHCNMTLIFNQMQAETCALAGATLVSPFVGRVYDWHLKDRGVTRIDASEDPGVELVKSIYKSFKKHGFTTEVMGASFRSIDQVLELAGCDLLTISPKLIQELSTAKGHVELKLSHEIADSSTAPEVNIDEKSFRWFMNEDAMATEKLSEGIRKFAVDTIVLERYLQKMM